jgi:small subunit ribosomal protein S17e
MGRVYTSKIKRISKEVLDNFPDAFSTDYEKNKEVLKGVLDTSSKKMTNQVAGYITRMKASKEAPEVAAEGEQGGAE